MTDLQYYEDFIQRKIAINCRTEDEVIKLAKWLDNHGTLPLWAKGGSLFTTTFFKEYREHTCYRMQKYSKRLGYADDFFYSSMGITVILWSDIDSLEDDNFNMSSILDILKE